MFMAQAKSFSTCGHRLLKTQFCIARFDSDLTLKERVSYVGHTTKHQAYTCGERYHRYDF